MGASRTYVYVLCVCVAREVWPVVGYSYIDSFL